MLPFTFLFKQNQFSLNYKKKVMNCVNYIKLQVNAFTLTLLGPKSDSRYNLNHILLEPQLYQINLCYSLCNGVNDPARRGANIKMFLRSPFPLGLRSSVQQERAWAPGAWKLYSTECPLQETTTNQPKQKQEGTAETIRQRVVLIILKKSKLYRRGIQQNQCGLGKQASFPW